MRLRLPILTALFSFGALAHGVTTASAGDVPCTGPLGAVTIKGNVVAGPLCDLSNTTVIGNVTVNPGGSLRIVPGSTTTISGNLVSRQATSIDVYAGSIGGDVTLDGTTNVSGGNTVLANGTVRGNVTIRNCKAFLMIQSETIGGNVTVYANSGSNSTGQFGFIIAIYQSTVAGNVQVYGNVASGSQDNHIAVYGGNIQGNLQVYNNTATGGTGDNLIAVFANIVDGNLQVYGNVAVGPAGSSSFIDVSGNTVDNNLVCYSDTPGATATLAGPNVADQKSKECAAL